MRLSFAASLPLSLYFSHHLLPFVISLSTVSRCIWTMPWHYCALPEGELTACMSRWISLPLSPPIPCIIPLWPVSSSLSFWALTLSLPLHSSVLNALPLSTLESKRSSLLWRRRYLGLGATFVDYGCCSAKRAIRIQRGMHSPVLVRNISQ